MTLFGEFYKCNGRPYFIAEAGVNHNGSYEVALKMIDIALEAGADAVKFQSFTARDLVDTDSPKLAYQLANDGAGSQYEMLKRLELTIEEEVKLARYCDKRSIDFIMTPFTIERAKAISRLPLKALKISSADIINYELLSVCADFEFPLILSTGMSTMQEVHSAMAFLESRGITQSELTILHCLSQYPAPADELNLLCIKTLAQETKCTIGYSDHCPDIYPIIVAQALGAKCIEKHFTLDKNMSGPDHASSLNPNELCETTKKLRYVSKMLGCGEKKVMPSEVGTRMQSRRSIKFARDIKEGEIIRREDLSIMRPGDGLCPSRLNMILGKPALKNYELGDIPQI